MNKTRNLSAAYSDVLSDTWPQNDLECVNTCPVCGEADRKMLYADLPDRVFRCAPGHWTLYECSKCGAGYLHPRPTPGSIHRAYTAYYTHTQRGGPEKVSRGVRRLASVVNRHFEPFCPLMQPRRLLDVGCGSGDFLMQMRGYRWETAGIDPDPGAAKAAQSAGLAVVQGHLPNPAYTPDSFDAITLNHVLEHLHDSIETLKHCRDLLKPGGMLWIATPNMSAHGHRGFGRNWIGLDAPRHLVLFTPDALQHVLQRAGLEMACGFLPTRAVGWHYAASTALKRGEDPLSRPRLPPLVRWKIKGSAWGVGLYARLRPACGEELILLAQRPASVSS